jgi:hypothetical protein
MTLDARIVSIGLDGFWTPMDLARLLHIVVRYYRLEQLAWLAESGGRNFFDSRLDAVVLKYLVAFDFIAAPLMSGAYNDSFEQSEEFVQSFGLEDLRIHAIRYDPPGRIEFAGIGRIMRGLHKVFDDIRRMKAQSGFVEGDSPDKFADIDAMYGAILRAKAKQMREAGYSEAELAAIVSPSIEDLHFISNAMTQGRITAVEMRSPAR